ncbi:hypothetical protein LSAT2_023516, partial [Lamellibrachia satsuma]
IVVCYSSRVSRYSGLRPNGYWHTTLTRKDEIGSRYARRDSSTKGRCSRSSALTCQPGLAGRTRTLIAGRRGSGDHCVQGRRNDTVDIASQRMSALSGSHEDNTCGNGVCMAI